MFHSAANNRPPACSAAFGPVRHLGYGQLVDSPGIADRNRRTANRETRAAAGPLLPDRPPVFHTAHGECGQAAPDQNDPSAPHRRGRTSPDLRSEEHTSELQSLMRISYAVFCLKINNYILLNLI